MKPKFTSKKKKIRIMLCLFSKVIFLSVLKGYLTK